MPNYFYDLPEELQEMIYKKMWVNVMQELVSLKEIADTYEFPYGYGGLTFHSIQTFYKYPAIAQLTLKNAVNNMKVINIFWTYSHTYRSSWKSEKSRFTYSNFYRKRENTIVNHEPIVLGMRYMEKLDKHRMEQKTNKELLMELLQANNQKVFKSWTQQKMVKALMKF